MQATLFQLRNQRRGTLLAGGVIRRVTHVLQQTLDLLMLVLRHFFQHVFHLVHPAADPLSLWPGRLDGRDAARRSVARHRQWVGQAALDQATEVILPTRLAFLLAQAQVNQNLAAVEQNAPSNQHGLLATGLLPQRFVHGVAEEVDHVHLAQVPPGERFELLPQHLGNPADTALAEQTLFVAVVDLAQQVLDVAGRQPAGVHLHHQLVEHFRTLAEALPQRRGPTLRPANLRQIDRHLALRTTQLPGLVPVAVGTGLLGRGGLPIVLLRRLRSLVALPPEHFAHFRIQHLLNHQLRRLADQPAGELLRLPAGAQLPRQTRNSLIQ